MAFYKLLFQENDSNSALGLCNLYGLLGMAGRETGFHSLSPHFLLTVSDTMWHSVETATASFPRHPQPVKSLQQNATCSLCTWHSSHLFLDLHNHFMPTVK